MAAPNSIERVPVAGVVVGALAATSGMVAAAQASVQLSGTTATQLAALTQMIITSSGATAAATVTVHITGISTSQIAGTALNMCFGVPAGAGVPAAPLDVNFDPPLIPIAGGAIKVEMPSLGTAHAKASITLLGKLIAAP